MRLALALLLLIAGAAEAVAQRVALVIGNGAYREAPALANPEADARGVAAALDRLGFMTDLVLDADRSGMEAAIRRFGEAAAGAEAALVYYAGHAVEVGGRNHLIPVSARIRSDRDLPFETIDFDAVMSQLEGRARVILVFLDACRDNPFRQRLMAGGTRGIAAAGLAPVRGPVGTLVAFATAPGQVASDGHGQNSPFTAALLRHIETPGLEVRPMLGRVRQSVREATAGSQVPWENSSLEGEFFFRAAAVAGPAPAAPQTEASREAPSRSGISHDGATERLFWESVKDTREPEELRAYLRRFPDGIFTELARARITALERAAQPPPPPPSPASAQAAAPPTRPPQPPAPPAAAAPVPSLPATPAPAPAPQPQREAAVRPPPRPPPAPPQPQRFAGRGGTVQVLSHEVPLPAGPWREAAKWVDHVPPGSVIIGGGTQFVSIHRVVLVQERDGRAVAAVRVSAIDLFGHGGGWRVPASCVAGASLARGGAAAMGGTIDCWQVLRRPVAESGLSSHLPAAAASVSQHSVGDGRRLLQVEYLFTDAADAAVAAWAPAAQAAVQEGFSARLGARGLPAP